MHKLLLSLEEKGVDTKDYHPEIPVVLNVPLYSLCLWKRHERMAWNGVARLVGVIANMVIDGYIRIRV